MTAFQLHSAVSMHNQLPSQLQDSKSYLVCGVKADVI